jgi:hypothetical protein
MNAQKLAAVAVALTLPLFLTPRLIGQQDAGEPSQGQPPAQGQPSGGMEHMPAQQGQSGMGQMHQDMQQHPEAAADANMSMSHDHMEMNPHMYMTALRPASPTDEKRSEQILGTLRQSIEKYRDYKAALAAGYQIYLPQLPQKHYHFTNWGYGYEAEFVFDPAHPTSLLFDKTPDGSFTLTGAMYTAPKRFTEDELNERVPLSIARWHKHINLCVPPKGQGWNAESFKKFGLGGSIATEEACQSAGGRWIPQIFGWMVHVYPFEQGPEKIWAH